MKALPGLFLLLIAATDAHAAQFEAFGDMEVHYVVVNTTFLAPEIAQQFGLARARDRAFVNISVLKASVPIQARITGNFTNLFGQRFELAYREVTEPPAVYYLAAFKHADQETLRFTVNVVVGDEPARVVEFQQTVYWESR